MLDTGTNQMPEAGHMARIEAESLKARPGVNRQAGKIGWALLWLLGIPLPILLIIFVLRGCH